MGSHLPPIITASLLESLSNEKLLEGLWYLIAATTLSQLNRPDQVVIVYQHAINQSTRLYHGKDLVARQMLISARIREALIKASAVSGLPKVTPSDRALLPPRPLSR
jgi:hypothetical protein